MLEGLEATIKSADANTTIVPGHGTLNQARCIEPYRDMILSGCRQGGANDRSGKEFARGAGGETHGSV